MTMPSFLHICIGSRTFILGKRWQVFGRYLAVLN